MSSPLSAIREDALLALSRITARWLNSDWSHDGGHKPVNRAAGSGIEFIEYRAWNHADDWRSIDWRASARCQQPQVRRYSTEASSDWTILLDSSASMMTHQADKWSLSLQCTAALAYLLLQHDNRVSLVLFNQRIEDQIALGRGHLHYNQILQLLARQQPATRGGDSQPICCLPALKRNSSLFIISDFLIDQQSMQRDLQRLAKVSNRMQAMQIYSQKDSQWPTFGAMQLQDVETAETIDIQFHDSLRLLPKHQSQRHARALAGFCQAQQIRYSCQPADRGWQQTLLCHLIPGYQP